MIDDIDFFITDLIPIICMFYVTDMPEPIFIYCYKVHK